MRIIHLFWLSACLIWATAPSAQAQCIEGDCTNGWGRFKDEKGRTYEGHFFQGKWNGKGTYKYANGDRYEGEWENGLPHGQGIRYFSDGRAEGGRWSKGQLVERNERIRRALECIKGDCKNGLSESRDAEGREYAGYFKNGQYEGMGKLKYPNGNYYEGIFKGGLPNGKGSYYYTNGHVETGVWERGQLKNEHMKTWAVVVGVADYPQFQKLTYTTEDAKKIYGFFRSIEGGAIPKERIKLLLDAEATNLGIQNAIADFAEQADSSDLIIFYFAGHGTQGAFIPYNSNGKDDNLLYHGVVNTLLMDSKAKFKFCIADACHSGSYAVSYDEYKKTGQLASATRSDKDVREKIKEYYKSFEHIRAGLAIMMSSASEEISLEATKLKQGVFSFFFIQGLKGAADDDKNNIITVKELSDYIQKQVRNFTYKFQNPQALGEYDDNMPVGIVHRKH